MAEKEKDKSCVYPCPGQCGETARYVQGGALPAGMQKMGIEGYDLIYVANTFTHQVFLCGTANGQVASFLPDPSQPVHEQAHRKASGGEMVQYEWSLAHPQGSYFFQSTLVPLCDKKGQVGSILGLVKNITDWAGAYSHEKFLKEVGQRTFPQVLLMAREEERRQISAALHDEIGSAAVILPSLLSMVKQSVESKDIPHALQDIAALDKQIKDSIERIKNIVVNMRPPNLEAVEIEEALRDLVQTMTRYRSIKPTFTYRAQDKHPVSDPVKIVLYRVTQESINNILKHAQASRVEVVLHCSAHKVRLTITDDGKGFDTAQSRSIEHIGLLSMRDSVAYLGGEFEIKSEPGKGTVIKVVCPRVVYGESSL